MIDELKGYDLNFTYNKKKYHVSIKNLDAVKTQKLYDIGASVYSFRGKTALYFSSTRKIVGPLSALRKHYVIFENPLQQRSVQYDLTDCTDIFHAFYGYKGPRLFIDSFDTSKFTDFSYMFKNCKFLRSTGFENWDVSNGENFESMFENYSNLEELDLSKWKFKKKCNLTTMFAGCKNLKVLNLSGWDLTEAILVNIFYDCNRLAFIKAYGCDEETIHRLRECAEISLSGCKVLTNEK